MQAAQRRLLVLVVLVAVPGAALVGGAALEVARTSEEFGPALLLVGVLSLLTDITATDVRIGRQVESYTWAELTVVLGLALLPSDQLLLTAGLVALGYAAGGLRGVKLAFNAGCHAVGLGLAVLAVQPLPAPSWDRPVVSGLVLLAGAGVFAVWNKVAVDLAIALSQGLRLRDVVRPGTGLTLLVFVGNVGLAFAMTALARKDPALVLVAPVCVLLVAFGRRWYLRVVQDREVWRHLEVAGRELSALDETTLAEAGLRRVTALLGADGARLRLHRDGADEVHVFDGEQVEAPVTEPHVLCDAVRTTVLRTTSVDGREEVWTTVVAPLGDAALGALEVRFGASVRLSARETGVLSAYAGTLAIALANARLHTRVQEQAERYARASLTDSLTGLANRARLLQDAEPEWLTASSRALLLLDLDGFKAVNDTHGHAVGDALLQVVAQRLTGAVRPSDLVCRLGGDEFAVLLDEGAGATACAARIRHALAAPVDVEGRRMRVGTSIGSACSTEDGADLDALLRSADARMYLDKAARRETVVPRLPEAAPAGDGARQVIRLERSQASGRGR